MGKSVAIVRANSLNTSESFFSRVSAMIVEHDSPIPRGCLVQWPATMISIVGRAGCRRQTSRRTELSPKWFDPEQADCWRRTRVLRCPAYREGTDPGRLWFQRHDRNLRNAEKPPFVRVTK